MSLSSSSSQISLTSDGAKSAGNNEATFPFPQVVEGYDHEFVPHPEPRYECPICLLVLREPYQTKCGHIFCRDCIFKSFRNMSCNRCPVDNEPLKENEIYPDNFAKREILNFNIKCPNSHSGCDKIFPLGKLQSHSNECTFTPVPCPYKCPCIIRRSDISNHLTISCENRAVECEHCHSSMQAKVIKEHMTVCPNVVVACPYCEEKRARCEIEHHVQSECQQVEIQCPFYIMGCTSKMARHSVDEHLRLESSSHMKQLCHTVTNLAERLGIADLILQTSHGQSLINGCSAEPPLRSQSEAASAGSDTLLAQLQTQSLEQDHGKEGENGLTGYSEATSVCGPDAGQCVQPEYHLGERNGCSPGVSPDLDQKYRMAGLSQAQRAKIPVYRLNQNPKLSASPAVLMNSRNPHSLLQDQSVEISGYTNSGLIKVFQEMNARFEEKEAAQRQKYDELHSRFLAVERANSSLAKMMKNLEQSLMDKSARFYNGEFCWSISQFSQYRQKLEAGESSILHSPPFYTSPWGYKICIRANIDRNSGNGQHLSLFIHFMKSSNDAFLTWPFSGRFTICVVDQNPDVSRRVHMVETLEANPNLAAFQRPTTPRNYKGFGYVDFLSVTAIENGTFLMDDTLVIRTQVFPSNH